MQQITGDNLSFALKKWKSKEFLDYVFTSIKYKESRAMLILINSASKFENETESLILDNDRYLVFTFTKM